MAYGIWCTIIGSEVLLSAPNWWLKTLGGLAVAVGLLIMAGEEKVDKKTKITLLEIGRELLRRR